MDLNETELLSKLNLMNAENGNQEFVKNLTNAIEYIDENDINILQEECILQRIFPTMDTRLKKIYNDCQDLFQTSDDDITQIMIKDNLVIISRLTSSLQQILNIVSKQNINNLISMESIIKFIPDCNDLYIEHWKNSESSYKSIFNEQIVNNFEEIKQLSVLFIDIIHNVELIEETDADTSLLLKVLQFISRITEPFYETDIKFVLSTWKYFILFSTKYSNLLEDRFNIRMVIDSLFNEIYKIFDILLDEVNIEAIRIQIKIITFFIKTLLKICDIYYKQIESIMSDLIIFYIKIYRCPLDYFASETHTEETLQLIETSIFLNIDVFLEHLIINEPLFKDCIQNISGNAKLQNTFLIYPVGVVYLHNKILKVLANCASGQCTDFVIRLVENVFESLNFCHKELFWSGYKGGIFQDLIINISAVLLLHDTTFSSANILVKHLVEEDPFIPLLSIEVISLITSNLPSNECFLVLTKLLNSNQLLFRGSFTNCPELVFFKVLLQRIFKNISEEHFKEEFTRMASLPKLEILKLSNFPATPNHPVIKSTLDNVLREINLLSNCQQPIYDSEKDARKPLPLSVSQNLEFLGTILNLPAINDISSFLNFFWQIKSNSDILQNNIFQYVVRKLVRLTANGICNSTIDSQIVFSQLNTMTAKEDYSISTYRFIDLLLQNSMKQDTNFKRQVAKNIASIIAPLFQNGTLLIKEIYLEMLWNLNVNNNHMLNMILDGLPLNIAEHIYNALHNESTTKKITQFKDIKCKFEHKCIQWKKSVPSTSFPIGVNSNTKRGRNENCQTFKRAKTTIQEAIKPPSGSGSGHLMDIDENVEDDDATEIIDRLKGEVKCLLKLCKNEKLTAKNTADLRIIISQITSVMR